MYKIKIACTNLRVDNSKINRSVLETMSSKLQLKSYSYIDKMLLVYKKPKNKNFTDKILEFYCTDKITNKQVKRFVNKMCKSNMRAHVQSYPVMVELINVSTNETIYRCDLKGNQHEIKARREGLQNTSQYRSQTIWKHN